MILVTFSKVSLSYGGNLIIDQLDLDIQSADRIGLVGENGSGKSSICRLIAGEVVPIEGDIARSQGLRIGFLHQEADPVDSVKTVFEAVVQAAPQLTALQARLYDLEHRMANIRPTDSPDEMEQILTTYGEVQTQFEALGGYDIEHRARSVLSGLGFEPRQLEQSVGTLSGGEKKIFNLAKLLLQNPDLLLMDEPDNHLDLDARAWLESYIRTYPGAVVIISHDRHLLDEVAQKILQVEDGQVTVFHGNYTHYITERQHRLVNQQQLYDLQQREIKRLEAAYRQLKEWARMRTKFAPRAESMAKRVERAKKEAAARPNLNRKTISVDLDSQRSGRKVLELRHVSKSIDGRPLFAPFDLDILYGEHIGIVGPNGSGKTTLMRVIMQAIPADTGTAKVGANVVMGYYAQEQETLPLDKTPLEYVKSLRPMTEEQAFGTLRRLLFSSSDVATPIGRLSGGEKSRLQIARLMLTEANFLLLDEPTNNLDIPSAEVLESALEEFEGTILTVSHDRYFLDKTVDRIIAVEGDGQVRLYPGSYSYYSAARASGV